MPHETQVPEFLKLVTSHEVRLRAFALSLIPHWADAEEILQQAYLVMWQKFDGFEVGSSFFSWSARIIHLTALDFRKRQRRSAIRFGDEFLENVAQETCAAADELAERERALSECVKKLKPKQRQLLDLRYREDRSGEQMARAMGTTADAVYQALARIRKALLDCVSRRLGQSQSLA